MTQISFIQFLKTEKRNRQFLVIAGFALILQFIIFKSLYPFADFFSDSYSYIYAASDNLDIGIWPIGYSKFLRVFHFLTHSDTAIVAFQYFLLEISCLYFFFTILYFNNPGRATRNILFSFLFFNPLFLYLSNYINSDPIFSALSLFWISELLWIINRPRSYQVFTQAILLFFCFTVRNNAYYYPIIAIAAFILSRQPVRTKIIGSLAGIVLIFGFVLFERDAAEKLTGTRQFSLFTGWQLANNALYMYGHAKVDSTQLPSVECRELDRLSRQFYSKIPPDFNEYLSDYVGNFFIRQPQSPLKEYMRSRYQSKDEKEGVVAWGKASAIFSTYGTYLIKHNKIEFARYFLLPNIKNYFFPPLEKLEVYNLGESDVSPIAQNWFDYETPAITSVSSEIQGLILLPFPYIFFFLNVLFIGGFAWYILRRRRFNPGYSFNVTMFIAAGFLIANFCFCVSATIIVLRYQFFPMIITLTFSLLLMEVLDKKAAAGKVLSLQTGEASINLELAKL